MFDGGNGDSRREGGRGWRMGRRGDALLMVMVVMVSL